MVFDFHTHVFSPEVIAGRAAFVERDAWFGQLYADRRAGLASPDELLASMEQAGIDGAVVCGFPWSDPGICAAENDFLRETAAASEGRLVAFATVPPGAGEVARREAERSLARGARGIGELNATAQGFAPGDIALLRPLVGAAQAHAAPLLLHATEPVGHRYPGKGRASLRGICRLAEAFPEALIVLAHWGGGLLFYELMPEVERSLANVYYDTAASAYLYRPTVFRVAEAMDKAGKVLFASDYPVLSQRRMLEQVRGQHLPAAIERQVLGETARSILEQTGR